MGDNRYGGIVAAGLTMGLAIPAAAPRIAAQDAPRSQPVALAEVERLAADAQEEVERLRGWKFKRPVPVRLLTQEEARTWSQEVMAEEAGDAQHRALELAAARMIGLLPPDCDPMQVFSEIMCGNAPGMYDHHAKVVYVVDVPDADYCTQFVCTTLVHELTHALDDQYFDLVRLLDRGKQCSDAQHVIGAVVEGSAIVLQNRYSAISRLLGRGDREAMRRSVKRAMQDAQRLMDAPPYVAAFMARFPCGSSFLVYGQNTLPGGGEGVGDALRIAAIDPPCSTEQILHPAKYWEDNRRDEPVQVDENDVRDLLADAGLHSVHTDTMGELYCAILTRPEDRKLSPTATVMPGFWTNPAAAGWGGDRFFLLSDEPLEDDGEAVPAELCGLWLTAWDTPADREEFITAYAEHRPSSSRTVLRLGTGCAVFFYGIDQGQKDFLAGRLQSSPPRCTHHGLPWRIEAPG
ncbi:MAG: hypothetical protein JSU68_12095 [Phycisphaerales bacterium]|nr:MAG: hypothetical protein JSU68_12095 [Phycisphaerales bacterium]